MEPRYVVITKDNEYGIFDTEEDRRLYFRWRFYRKRYGFFGPKEVYYDTTMYCEDRDYVVQTCKRLNTTNKDYLKSIGYTFLEEEN